jgi:hypothetical protein
VACRLIVARDRPSRGAGRFQRGGLWWLKLRPDDPSFGRGDARGYLPAHIVIAERVLARRIRGDERVRWFSANHLDVRPGNLYVQTATAWCPLVGTFPEKQHGV